MPGGQEKTAHCAVFLWPWMACMPATQEQLLAIRIIAFAGSVPSASVAAGWKNASARNPTGKPGPPNAPVRPNALEQPAVAQPSRAEKKPAACPHRHLPLGPWMTADTRAGHETSLPPPERAPCRGGSTHCAKRDRVQRARRAGRLVDHAAAKAATRSAGSRGPTRSTDSHSHIRHSHNRSRH